MNITEFFTWQTLTTFAGAMAATGVITQFLKGVLNIPVRILAYIVAVVVLAGGVFFVGEANISSIALCFLNGVIIATATSGTIDAVKEVKKQ